MAGGLQLSLYAPDRGAGTDGQASVVRQLERARADVARLSAQLANPRFVDRAKPEVVAGARARLAQAEEGVAALERALGPA